MAKSKVELVKRSIDNAKKYKIMKSNLDFS